MSGLGLAASEPGPQADVAAALHLVRSACQAHWVGLARPVSADAQRLALLDHTGQGALSELELDLSVWSAHDGHAQSRPSAAWVLACGALPVCVAWRRMSPAAAAPGWVLVVAWAQPVDLVAMRPGLDDAARVLEAVYLSGRLGQAERQVAARLTAIIDHLDAPVLFVQARQGQVHANRAAWQLLEMDAQHTTPMQLAQAWTAWLARGGPGSEQALQQLAQHPQATVRLLAEPDARVFDVRSHRIEAGGMSGRLWVCQDITELRQRERALMEGLRNETIGRMTGGIAHQFNNLLQVVIGEAEAVSDAGVWTPSTARQLHGIVQAAERGADIVGQLLAFAQRRTAAPEPFDLVAEVLALRPLLTRLLPPAVSLTLPLARGPAWVLADRNLFADAMVHLVLNARDAMPHGGSLHIGCDPQARLTIPTDDPAGQAAPPGPSASAAAWASAVALTVRDTGTGMAEPVRSRAFEPFFTTKGLASARGLGLSVVQGWARQSGGQAHIDSVPGQGTCVTLIIPRVPEQGT